MPTCLAPSSPYKLRVAEAMSYREFLPHEALRPFVDRFWVSFAEVSTVPWRVLPDGCIDLLVNLTRGVQAVAVGAMTRAVLVDPRASARTVAVRFRPGGAVPFLHLSADTITDQMVDCADIGVQWLADARLEGLTNPIEAVRPLELAH